MSFYKANMAWHLSGGKYLVDDDNRCFKLSGRHVQVVAKLVDQCAPGTPVNTLVVCTQRSGDRIQDDQVDPVFLVQKIQTCVQHHEQLILQWSTWNLYVLSLSSLCNNWYSGFLRENVQYRQQRFLRHLELSQQWFDPWLRNVGTPETVIRRSFLSTGDDGNGPEHKINHR